MHRRLTIALSVASCLAVLAVAGVGRAAAEARCYGEWSEAAPIVAREKLKSALDVQGMARAELGGEVVRIVLCEGDGVFVYRLVLKRLDGRIGTLTVNAAPGRGR
jgi:uncharacterized membrane protein YkoI